LKSNLFIKKSLTPKAHYVKKLPYTRNQTKSMGFSRYLVDCRTKNNNCTNSMKNHSDGKYHLRNDRSTWLTVAAVMSGCALASSASAQVNITDSVVAPSANIIASQLTDLGPGAQDNNRDYMNNGGTVGQTFEVGSAGLLNGIAVQGRGDSAMYYSGGPVAFAAGTIWSIQISSVSGTGALTVLDTESSSTYVPTGGGAADSAYLTYTLANPVNLVAGQEYAFNLYVNDQNVRGAWNGGAGGALGQSWFGLAHATSADATATQYAMNSDSSTVNTPGTGPVDGYGAFAAPNPGGYSYVFAAIGTVPEPTTLALIGLGSLGLIVARRRRA
jgi:hypothetical protein